MSSQPTDTTLTTKPKTVMMPSNVPNKKEKRMTEVKYPQKRCANPLCSKPIDRHMDFCDWDCAITYAEKTRDVKLRGHNSKKKS